VVRNVINMEQAEQLSIGTERRTKHRTVCMMVNLLNDSNFHRQTAFMTRLFEMIIQNPVFGISCIISMLVHSTSQCLTSFTNIQKSTECTFYVVNDISSRTVQRVHIFHIISLFSSVFSKSFHYATYISSIF
jgi:hypothetical protein